MRTNEAVLLLPYARAAYDHITALRNAIAHGSWEEIDEKLGGPNSALAWSRSFYSLVVTCGAQGFSGIAARAALLLGNADWPFPPMPSSGKEALKAT